MKKIRILISLVMLVSFISCLNATPIESLRTQNKYSNYIEFLNENPNQDSYIHELSLNNEIDKLSYTNYNLKCFTQFINGFIGFTKSLDYNELAVLLQDMDKDKSINFLKEFKEEFKGLEDCKIKYLDYRLKKDGDLVGYMIVQTSYKTTTISGLVGVVVKDGMVTECFIE